MLDSRRLRCVHLVLANLLLASCASSATTSQLLRRASFDLDCAEASLRVVELDNRTRGVDGCGRRASYVETCRSNEHGNYDCTWALNSPGDKR